MEGFDNFSGNTGEGIEIETVPVGRHKGVNGEMFLRPSSGVTSTFLQTFPIYPQTGNPKNQIPKAQIPKQSTSQQEYDTGF